MCLMFAKVTGCKVIRLVRSFFLGKAMAITTFMPCTEWMECMSHRKQKETKQHPGTAGPGNILGCCLVYLRFLYDIHSIYPVYAGDCGEPGPVSHFADIAHSFYQLSALLRPQNWVCAFFNFCALPIPSIPLPWPAAAPMGWH